MTDIRKQIATLPDDAILQAAIGPTLQVSIKAADLKALADSHSDLVAAIRVDYEITSKVLDVGTAVVAFTQSIRAANEAEQLGTVSGDEGGLEL